MKKCSTCGQVLSESAFYRNRAMRDGLSNDCKQCHNEATRRYAEKHPDTARQLSRESKRRQRAREGEEVTRAKWREWYARNQAAYCAKKRNTRVPEQARAHYIVSQALKHGVLVRPERCERCGARGDIEGHHADYSQPLNVTWLCTHCHRMVQG